MMLCLEAVGDQMVSSGLSRFVLKPLTVLVTAKSPLKLVPLKLCQNWASNNFTTVDAGSVRLISMYTRSVIFFRSAMMSYVVKFDHRVR